MRNLLFAMVIFASSCAPSFNQVLNSPHLAEAAALKYPVKDSIGEAIITHHPADNKDHTGEIDSLNSAIYTFSLRMAADRKALEEKGRCCEIAREYVSTVDSLLRQNQKLKDKYKPCKPDTVERKVNIYLRDLAAEAVQKNRADKAEQKVEDLTTGRNTWRWISIGCFLVIGGAVFSKIKGFI